MHQAASHHNRTLTHVARTGPNQYRSVQTRLAEEFLSSLDDAGDMRAAVPLYLESLQHVLRCQTDIVARIFGMDAAPPGMGSLGAFLRRVTNHMWAMQLLRLGALEPHVIGCATFLMPGSILHECVASILCIHYTTYHRDAVDAFCGLQKTMLKSPVFGSTRQRTTHTDTHEQNDPTHTSKRASMDRIENAETVLRVRCT